jgi:hypothetical protein
VKSLNSLELCSGMTGENLDLLASIFSKKNVTAEVNIFFCSFCFKPRVNLSQFPIFRNVPEKEISELTTSEIFLYKVYQKVERLPEKIELLSFNSQLEQLFTEADEVTRGG